LHVAHLLYSLTFQVDALAGVVEGIVVEEHGKSFQVEFAVQVP